MRVIGFVALGALFAVAVTGSSRAALQEPESDRPDLRRMFDEDQADRGAANIDWTVVRPRDEARRTRVLELFAAGSLRTGGDLYRAAMILQHGSAPEDFLLAHELCVAAMALGRNDDATRWLAAASEDRFLMNLERPQRFGTQYRADASMPLSLYAVDPAVTDELRRIMATPTLAEAKAREAELRRK